MRRRHFDSHTFQNIHRCRRRRGRRRRLQLRRLIRILTRTHRLSTPIILTILITLTTRIIQPRIFTVLRLAFFMVIQATTAITVTMGIGVIAGTAELMRRMHWQGSLDLHPEAVAGPQAADKAAQSGRIVRNPG